MALDSTMEPIFPNAVGMIDGTIHRIRRPSGLI